MELWQVSAGADGDCVDLRIFILPFQAFRLAVAFTLSADKAMYQAKKTGKNRVVAAS